MLERRVRLAGSRVVQNRVAVGERAALRVLARQADRNALLEQRRERERLRVAPVDPALVERRPALRSSCLASFGLTSKPSGTRSSCSLSSRRRSAGTAVTTAEPVSERVGRLGRWHRRGERLPELVVRGSQLGERLLEQSAPRSLSSTTPSATSRSAYDLAHRTLLRDPLRLQRLRVRGLVLLVVAEAAIADEIDDDVVAELLAVREREADRRDRRLGIVGVDVDDRHVEALGEVARVARRASLGGIGREADLVVGDEVKRPARRVAVERVQVERLRDDALTRRTRRRRG